jgi:hypothetical protein
MSVPSVSFAIDDDVRLRAYIGAIGSAVGILIAVLPICVMLFHPYYKGSLRLNFNWMLIVACMLYVPVSLARIAASASLLRGTMTIELCNVTGTIISAGLSAAIFMLLAFYWSFLTLRLTAIRRVYDKLVPRPWQEHFGVGFATAAGLVLGTTEACVYTFAKRDVSVATGTNYNLEFGWCGTGNIQEASYVSGGIISLSLIPCASIACVVALRCDYCLGLAIRQRLGLFSHWPIYVRFFGMVLYTAVYAVLITMHEFHGGSHLMLPSTILAVLSGPALSLIFLFTEGVPQVVIYRLIKKRFPSPRTKKRNAQRTPSSVAYRELTTNSYQYVHSSGGDVDCEEGSHDDDNEHDDEDDEHDAMTGDTVIR